MDENDEQRFELESMRQAWEEEQSQFDLPAHKRDGYAENMMEHADMRRKEIRENGR